MTTSNVIAEMTQIDTYSSSNVLFLFPNPPHPPRTLWGNSTTLVRQSSYFESLFDGGFSEGTHGISPPAIPCTLKPHEDETHFHPDESEDDEDEGTVLRRAQPSLIHRVVVKDTTYKVYRALLCYLNTGHISFARLRSNPLRDPTQSLLPIPYERPKSSGPIRTTKIRPGDPTIKGRPRGDSSTARALFDGPPSHSRSHSRGSYDLDGSPQPSRDLLDRVTSTSTLEITSSKVTPSTPSSSPSTTSTPPRPPIGSPSPVSPKSIYLLADRLMISKLKELALASFKSQLHHKNVLEELLSQAVDCCPELREAAIGVAESRWSTIVQGGELKKVRERAAAGELTTEQVTALLDISIRLGGGN
ncbi:hypothetical protein P7C70_g4505, partial [Phenoliferia sp. Uapishka_3]